MAAARRGDAIAFEALSIEGGLLMAEWLAKVAQLGASAQTPDDYRVPKGLELREEISRSWRIAQAHWNEWRLAEGAGPSRFVDGLLREAFGFASLAPSAPRTIGERVYPVSFFALQGKVPVVVSTAENLDTKDAALGDGNRRRTGFGLLQEFLNASDDALWGLASDGRTLRLARDNASLTRPAWVAADLARIFDEELHADFAALWLLFHETRFGRAGEPAKNCPLEQWREAGREAGTVARDRLRAGFEDALETLGKGFLSHPANRGLRDALHAGRLHRDAYYGQLLRLVYRLIFILTVEERELLHPAATAQDVKTLYAVGYALRRLRDRVTRRLAHDRHTDLWEGVKIVFRGLAAGEPRLGLPALAGLFAPQQCPDLDGARLENRALLLALFHLAWLREPAGLVRVNWRDMGPDELGYVYEGLLELVPQIVEDGRSFTFAGTDESRGHARKTTGSYYTPDELVQLLLDSAVDPVIQRTMQTHPDHSVEALLRLAIVDPACGSGHFLLAAARRVADQVARLRAEGTPTPDEYQLALREVVKRCLYGVDMNPLAVELCKVSLWMESIAPGLPLTFLESHIRHGNSLLGTTQALMGDEVPEAAWVALEGDDTKVVSALKRRNKAVLDGQRPIDYDAGGAADTQDLQQAMAVVEQAPDEDAAELAAKEERWKALLASGAYAHAKLVADAWCAAFVWPMEKRGLVADAAPTTEVWRALRADARSATPELRETTGAIAEQYALFHWELAFPHVFAAGGFDVVLGNPPWERLKLQEQEFFAQRDPSIAKARNAAARKKRIQALPTTDVQLWQEWCAAARVAQGQSHFARNSGRYPLCGKGDVNTYALFAEHNWSLLGPQGRAGFIVPSGIATDDTTKGYFQALLDRKALASVYHFENEELIFKGLHHAYRFVLMTLGPAESADLVFYARRTAHIAEQERHFSLSADDFVTLNPNTRTCPTFRSRRDAEINLAMYRRTGVLWREDDPEGNPWGLRFMAMLHMANDSDLFRRQDELLAAGWTLEGNRFVKDGDVMLPLYEAKMIHHFDHRFGTYEGQTEAQANQGKLPELDGAAHADPWHVTLPRYWVHADEVAQRLDGVWNRHWLPGWRDITGTEKQRTTIACVLPRVGVGHTTPLMFPAIEAPAVGCFTANLASLAFDYAARQKVGGTHLTYSYLKQLPALRQVVYEGPCAWSAGSPRQDWLLPRVLELTYTAWDLQPFAEDCGDTGPPYIWNPERRFQLRCELDAAFFHLYGISRDDADYILGTFPVLRRSEERAHGEYRTRRVILEIYDALAQASSSGEAYVSPLGPPQRATEPDRV